MLKIENLHVFYGGIHALKGIRLNVAEEKIAALIGANGAGKSTLLRTICGLSRAAQGTIKFLGSPIENLPTHRIIQSGVAMVPEGRKVFVDLSIRENLLMGAFNREDHLEVRNDIDWLYTLFPRLQERASQPAGTLSGGEQQMLALGRALMSRPKLLLLDEPSLGLSPLMIQEVFHVIRQVNREGMTILLIEQNAMAALQISDYGYVLETGRIILEAPGNSLLNDPRVREAYFGES
jgi:branched-chain amino acid transport system ATP-binding protein